MTPTLALTCSHCDWQPKETLTMQDVLDHYQNAHNVPKNEINLNLSAICECGSVMTFTFTKIISGNHFEDHFKCFKCNRTGFVLRNKNDK